METAIQTVMIEIATVAFVFRGRISIAASG
jgi:hypothetical protein